MLGRVVGAVVHAHADGQVRRFGGRGDDDLPRARLEVLGGLVALGEEAAALEDQVHAELLPGQLGGIALGEHADRLPVDGEPVLVRAHVPGEGPVDGVVLEEVRERLRVGDVVHGDELERALVEAGAEHVPPDAAEAIDADADRHGSSLLRTGPRARMRAARGVSGEFFYSMFAWGSRRSAFANLTARGPSARFGARAERGCWVARR